MFLAFSSIAACHGADVGLGVSMWSSSSPRTIFVPIRVKNLLLEGSLSVGHSNQDSSSSTSTYRYDSSNTFISPGIGVFGIKPITDNSHAYFGARIAYLYTKGAQDRIDTSTTDRYEAKSTGYSIEPTIGVEYFPIKHMSIGGEISYYYSKETVSATATPNQSSLSHYSGSGAISNIIIRWYF